MRALSRLAGVAALSLGVSLPGIMSGGAGMPRFVRVTRERAPGEEKDGPRKRARDKARREDPYFELRSKGRTGAQRRAADMAEAYRKTGRRDRDNPAQPVGTVFHSRKREDAFRECLALGWSRGRALKIARRVAA